MKNCETCIHSRVCSHKNQYEQYVEEFNELSKKWDLFQSYPMCPEWHDIKLLENKRNEYTKRFKEDPKVTYEDLKRRESISETFKDMSGKAEVCPSKDTYSENDELTDYFLEVLGLKARK